MKPLPKIMITIAIIGFIFLFIALSLRGYNFELSNKLAYSGLVLLAMYVFIAVVIAITAIAAVLNNRFKSYILQFI